MFWETCVCIYVGNCIDSVCVEGAASVRSAYSGSGRWFSYLAPSGGRGSCLGLRTGVSPHFSTSSKREMLADHERGAASPPSSPMTDFRGCTLTRPRLTHRLRPADALGLRRDASAAIGVALLPTERDKDSHGGVGGDARRSNLYTRLESFPGSLFTFTLFYL